jgi:hypothetical protein
VSRGVAKASIAIAALALLPVLVSAKTYRYEGGPQPQPDTTLSVAVPELEQVVRSRGPKVPLTNLQLLTLVSNTAFEHGLEGAPLQKGQQVVLAPAGDHPLGFVAEHSVLRVLGRRGVTAMVRRAPIPDDSVMALSNPDDPILEYQLASARVTYLRLRGWLPGRVKIERQALVDARLTLRSARQGTVLWSGDAAHNLVDAFPRSQLILVEDARYEGLKSEPPGRTVDKVFEPVIVVAIVAGLIALFFQNRP